MNQSSWFHGSSLLTSDLVLCFLIYKVHGAVLVLVCWPHFILLSVFDPKFYFLFTLIRVPESVYSYSNQLEMRKKSKLAWSPAAVTPVSPSLLQFHSACCLFFAFIICLHRSAAWLLLGLTGWASFRGSSQEQSSWCFRSDPVFHLEAPLALIKPWSHLTSAKIQLSLPLAIYLSPKSSRVNIRLLRAVWIVDASIGAWSTC